jgi:hypothetical protein
MSYNPNNSELDAELFGGYVPGQETIRSINDNPQVDMDSYEYDAFRAKGYGRGLVNGGGRPVKRAKKLSVDGRDPFTLENLRPMPDSVLSLVEQGDLPRLPEDFRSLDPKQCLEVARAMLKSPVIECENIPLIPQDTARRTQDEDPMLTSLRERLNGSLRSRNINGNTGIAA